MRKKFGVISLIFALSPLCLSFLLSSLLLFDSYGLDSDISINILILQMVILHPILYLFSIISAIVSLRRKEDNKLLPIFGIIISIIGILVVLYLLIGISNFKD